MAGNSYVGAFSTGDILGEGVPRYFYGIRRDEDGDLFFVRIDQKNLKYEQYRWDARPVFYYIDDEGNLTLRVNEGYDYPTGL